jgi:hypothetical protein
MHFSRADLQEFDGFLSLNLGNQEITVNRIRCWSQVTDTSRTNLSVGLNAIILPSGCPSSLAACGASLDS